MGQWVWYGIIRKEKLGISEIEDAIQSNADNGSIGLINSIANLFVDDKITLEQAKSQIEEKNILLNKMYERYEYLNNINEEIERYKREKYNG